jgi:hypothetical protein
MMARVTRHQRERQVSSLKLKRVCAATLTFTASTQIYMKVHKVLTPTVLYDVDVCGMYCSSVSNFE